ncbi:MAG: chromosomal replication initiator protein DnaA [Eubacterium sp.]
MENFNDLWDLVLQYCKHEVNTTAFDLWLSPIEMVSFSGDKATLKFSNKFRQNTVVGRYEDLLNRAFAEVCGFDVELSYISAEDEITEKEQEADNNSNSKNQTLTFENFIVGPSNKFVYAAAKAIAADPGGQTNNSSSYSNYNPLFIYGPSGLGKTHLLNAISYEVNKNYPEMNIVYVKAENFVNEFISSINKKAVDEFHEKYRTGIDLFLVDDVQSIAGKTQTEEEFFHTFNSLVDNGKQVVLTSDRPPKEIKSLTERLCSRFESGLLADVQPPEFETRCAIIKRKAQLLDFDISDNIVEYIAQNIKSNIRQLEGITNKLQALCKLSGQNPTIALAQTAIRDVQDYVKPVEDIVKNIVEEVSRTTGVSVEDIYSKKQTSDVSNARKMCFYIIREVTNMSFKAIGEKFKRDHSTVMYNVEKYGEIIKKNSTINYQVSDIINNVKDLQ